MVSAATEPTKSVSKPTPRQIHGRFDGKLNEGMGVQPVNFGAI